MAHLLYLLATWGVLNAAFLLVLGLAALLRRHEAVPAEEEDLPFPFPEDGQLPAHLP